LRYVGDSSSHGFLISCAGTHKGAAVLQVATFGKGITACDEGPGTIGDRFEKVGIVNTEENRRWAPAPASVAFLVLFRAARGAARRFLAAGYMGQASGADSVAKRGGV
jgi:hypothetical protein